MGSKTAASAELPSRTNAVLLGVEQADTHRAHKGTTGGMHGSHSWVRSGLLPVGLPGKPLPRRLERSEVKVFRKQSRQVLLALGMLVSGTANTVTCKLAMSTTSVGRHGGKPRPFNHPFVMAGFMFLGEIMCLAVYYLNQQRKRSSKKRFKTSACALPACCDIAATSTMYVGLTLTTASTYQMLRGSVVLFTGAFSVFFLGRKQWAFHWVGLFTVFGGTMVVGLSSLLSADGDAAAEHAAPMDPSMLILGDALVVIAQLFTATQMCLEERFVSGHNMPALLAVGCEGIWGLLGLLALLVALQNVHTASGSPVEDSIDAVVQVCNRPKVLLLLLANSGSIALFNAFGITITKISSAAYRMVLDSMRTLTVWIIGLSFSGETFHWLQVCGFALLATGTVVYNEAVRLPCGALYPSDEQREEDRQAQQARRVKPALEEQLLQASPPSAHGAKELKVDDLFSPALTRWNLKMGK